MDKVTDPCGYWGQLMDSEFTRRLAVQGERRRWRAVLSKYMSPQRVQQIMEQVLDEGEAPCRETERMPGHMQPAP